MILIDLSGEERDPDSLEYLMSQRVDLSAGANQSQHVVETFSKENQITGNVFRVKGDRLLEKCR